MFWLYCFAVGEEAPYSLLFPELSPAQQLCCFPVLKRKWEIPSTCAPALEYSGFTPDPGAACNELSVELGEEFPAVPRVVSFCAKGGGGDEILQKAKMLMVQKLV